MRVGVVYEGAKRFPAKGDAEYSVWWELQQIALMSALLPLFRRCVVGLTHFRAIYPLAGARFYAHVATDNAVDMLQQKLAATCIGAAPTYEPRPGAICCARFSQAHSRHRRGPDSPSHFSALGRLTSVHVLLSPLATSR